MTWDVLLKRRHGMETTVEKYPLGNITSYNNLCATVHEVSSARNIKLYN